MKAGYVIDCTIRPEGFKFRSMRFPAHTVALLLFIWCRSAFCAAAQDAALYADAIAKINDAHVKQPGKNKEADLSKLIPPAAKAALKRVLEAKPATDVAPALLKCGEAALDLDQIDDFESIRKRLVELSPE